MPTESSRCVVWTLVSAGSGGRFESGAASSWPPITPASGVADVPPSVEGELAPSADVDMEPSIEVAGGSEWPPEPHARSTTPNEVGTAPKRAKKTHGRV